MRIYVETNFLLEMVFEQEQRDACESILRLAEGNATVTLAIPAVCFTEPHGRLRRQKGLRDELQEMLAKEHREFARTRQFTKEKSDAWSAVTGMLVSSTQEAEQRLESISERLLRHQVLPLTNEVIRAGLKYREDYGLSPPDALVLASVLRDPALKQGPSCFMNRNTKDFDESSIKNELEKYGCKLKGSFEAGLAYVHAALR
ncbi:type II toxin-antitoxin system VapC family toxin [Cystobacter fuscus]|uniref:type II toxin-antitoxin system VapC family toxin n=1 Tax=Cystobacter fuscus TaxID=43 RepID=UPI002B29F8EF|nr:type II toxin-antitoxin system VapC family toxin [Cystobacter fuscus]